MKKSLFMILALLLLTTAVSPAAKREKTKALDFTLPDLKGEQVKLSDYQGKVVLVNFWSTGCPPCVAEIPELNQLLAKMKGKPFAILALTRDPKPAVMSLALELKIKFTVLLDGAGQTGIDYGVYGLPTTFIIAPDGTIDNLIIGPAQWSDQSIVDYLNNLIKKSSE